LEPCRGHYLRHQRVVLAATRADGVDLLLHAIAASQQPKAAHQADVVCSEPADREHTKPAGRKHRQKRTVLGLADDAGPQALRLEPVVQLRSQRGMPCGQQHRQVVQALRKAVALGLADQPGRTVQLDR
jgi:hypothetical protein